MIYQHPLAYLVGLEGLALLRAWAGEHDRAFVDERLAELRRLLDDEHLRDGGILVERVDSVAGYRSWSSTYDEGPRNGLFDVDEPVVHEILASVPVGTALDAACGTGGYAEHLAGLGHRVIGVDSSPEMLEKARGRVPGAEFRLGDLDRLPVADASVDVVVCALALTHVRELGPAMAEFARVLRPGGHLVISDVHEELTLRGSGGKAVGPNGERAVIASYRHSAGDYLRAALPVGLRVLRCEEPRPETAAVEPASPTAGSAAEVPRGSASGNAESPDARSGAAGAAGAPGTGAPGTGAPGTGAPGTGAPDTGAPDTGAPDTGPAPRDPGPWEAWPWTLTELVPEATRAAWGTPSTIIWHFQLTPSGPPPR